MKRLALMLFLCSQNFNLISVMAADSAVSVAARDNRFPAILSDTLPELNRSILAFVDSKMKKKVGRGECWDLAAQALNAAGAKWNGKFDFGRKLSAGEEILPGDIIQFEGVKIKYVESDARYTQLLKHHTGIVYSMKGKKQFDMANQNTEHGRKVSLTYIDLNKVTSGKYFIYRPQR
jgi:hypothetical protein